MNLNRYIFLDIDGVLATTHQMYSNRKNWHPMYDRYKLDVNCVKTFNSILASINNPVIVITSDWKEDYNIEQFNAIFKINDVNAIVTDYIPSLWGIQYKTYQQLDECRAEEILKYQVDHADVIDKWVAIDDLNLFPWIPENFVRCTHANEGIKQDGVKDKILNILI